MSLPRGCSGQILSRQVHLGQGGCGTAQDLVLLLQELDPPTRVLQLSAADEEQLLTLLRRFLAGPAAAATGSGLPAHLLDAPTLRCKANLLTRLEGLDELVGPVTTQSVYVTLPNPIATR